MRLLFWRQHAATPAPTPEAEPTVEDYVRVEVPPRDELYRVLDGLADIPPDVWEANMAEVEVNVDRALAEQGIDPVEAANMTPQELYGS